MRDVALTAVLGVLLATVLAHPFVGVLLWNLIAFMNPHRMVWGFASAIPWAMVIFVITIIACIARGELRMPPANLTVVLLFALMVMFTITSIVALGEPESVWAKWDRVTKILLGLLLTAAMLTTRQRVHALIWLMVISLGYFGVRGGAFSIATGGSYRVWGPPETMVGDNNHLAAALLITLPLMNYLRMQSAHRIIRIGMWLAMGLTLFSIVGSHSRGALLALAAVAVVLWWRSQRKVISAVVLAVSLAGVVNFMPGNWTERMESITEYEQDGSAMGRLELWSISWRLAVSRPLVGTGYTGPYNQDVVDTVELGGRARAVHSIYFELLAEHGFIVFALWIGLSLTALWHSRRLIRLTRHRPDLHWGRDLARMAQVSIVAYHVGGAFLSLSYYDYYWTLLVVVAATHGLVMRALAQGAPAVTLPATLALPRPAPQRAPAAPPIAARPATGWRGRTPATAPR
jgi:putative inorganic carbon (hco3(-)) transporter